MPTGRAARYEEESPEEFRDRLGELLRRIALGLLTALVASRFYWPSELDPVRLSGAGLTWVLAILITTVVAIFGSVLGGWFRFRLSLVDIAVIALMVLVGQSASQGTDRRIAINLAWEWVGPGFAYLLARNLPRTRGESTAILGVLLATAVAVSAYGLFQSKVELPLLQERFRRNPQQVLQEANIPADPQSIRTFEDRLLGSNEIFSTFGLANSLAGFLVGPLVVGLGLVIQGLAAPSPDGSRWRAILMAIPPLLCLAVCLLLTKSRTAYVGLAVGGLVLIWQSRGLVSKRSLIGICATGLLLVSALVIGGIASGRLDREVLTQSPMSLRYRLEYWQGTWGIISNGADSLAKAVQSTPFWAGVGPGNFGHHYLLHKLPQATEEIQDPHNLFLEVWAASGVWAVLALAIALGLALWLMLGPAPSTAEADQNQSDDRGQSPIVSRETPGLPRIEAAPPPASNYWMGIAGLTGLLAVLIVGEFNLFEVGLLQRWVVLAVCWMMTALLGLPLLRHVSIPGSLLGAGVLAMVICLLGAGGIGFQSVSLCLWILIALGLNLRDDRRCGRLRESESRIPGFALAIVWAAVIGIFAGAIGPFWKSEAAFARAEEALSRMPPDFEKAQAAYEAAEIADRYNARPWIGDAYLQLLIWRTRGSKPTDQRWRKIPTLLLKAASGDRNPNVWTLHNERSRSTHDLLAQVGTSLSPSEFIQVRASVVEAARTASRLYPTNPLLRVRLAEASAEIQMFPDAVTEAEEALRLDAIIPPSRKLPDAVRESLKARLLDWTEKAAQLKPALDAAKPASK